MARRQEGPSAARSAPTSFSHDWNRSRNTAEAEADADAVRRAPPPTQPRILTPATPHVLLGVEQDDLGYVVVTASPTEEAEDEQGDAWPAFRSFRGITSAIHPPLRSPLASRPRMSVNPARAVQNNLRSSGTTSPADSAVFTSGTASTTSPRDTTDEQLSPPPSIAAHLLFNMADMDGALPENDGMNSLRQQLQEIKQLAVSTEEKAKRMHFLMTQDYMKHRTALAPSPASSPSSTSIDNDAPVSPMLGVTAAMPVDPNNPFNLRPGDLDPVFSTLPRNPKETDEDTGLDEAMEIDDGPELGCMHYKRNVKVQCYDCQRWFPCRHCHDQAKDLPFPHSLNRKKTQNMLCMLCQTPQPAAEVCVNCEEYAAWYYCQKCKLWDNDSNKRIYHCDDCGICRVGEGLGKDFVHCRRCNVCISISTSAAHPCIERATEGNCPLCLIALFESRTSVVSLPCGHYMHGDCYKDLMAVTYKCPVCSKSAVNMELQWRKLDDEIAAQPMPEEDEDLVVVLPHVEGHASGPDVAPAEGAEHTIEPQQHRPREVWVGCNDCGGRSWTPFHWLGLKCQRCDSYNTNQMAPTAVHETETERLMRQQQIRQHEFTGNAVLLDAGIGIEEAQEQVARTALEVPKSPSLQPEPLSSSPRSASGAQSPGRYFVLADEPRRPSFTAGRFSAPSMPNIPTLSTLADMPRMPRMPNLPHLPNFRQNLPNMPNVELPRFSPYEMIDAFSRSLSPMRYYLRGLDARDEDLDARIANRPTSVHSDPARRSLPSKLGTSSEGTPAPEEGDLWEDDDSDSVHALDPVDDSSSEEENGEDEDEEMEEDEPAGADEREWELFGHR